MRGTLMQAQTDTEMGVMVEVGAGGHDPIDEAALDQRDQTRDTKTCRRKGASEAETNRDIWLQHLTREELRRLTQPSGVVRKKSLVNQLDNANRRVHWAGIDLWSVGTPILPCHSSSWVSKNGGDNLPSRR